jgi:hypothetical protein
MAGNTLLELRRDTAANWTSANPTLAGDGSTAWTSLAYFGNPSVQSVASAATVTPTFKNDLVKITALAAACQLLNWTGLAAEGWGIVVRIKDNGTARALTYDTKYRAMGAALPTTTVISKTMYLAFIYNLTDDKFDLMSVVQQP